MNQLVSFRLCSLTDDELLQRVDNLTDNMYELGKVPERNIPARPDSDYDLLVGELIKRYQRLQSEKKEDGWISVEERLPNENEKVLCYNGFRYTENSHMEHTGQNVKWFKERYTHWMPLPEPPQSHNPQNMNDEHK